LDRLKGGRRKRGQAFAGKIQNRFSFAIGIGNQAREEVNQEIEKTAVSGYFDRLSNHVQSDKYFYF